MDPHHPPHDLPDLSHLLPPQPALLHPDSALHPPDSSAAHRPITPTSSVGSASPSFNFFAHSPAHSDNTSLYELDPSEYLGLGVSHPSTPSPSPRLSISSPSPSDHPSPLPGDEGEWSGIQTRVKRSASAPGHPPQFGEQGAGHQRSASFGGSDGGDKGKERESEASGESTPAKKPKQGASSSFVPKLYQMVNDPTSQTLIAWNLAGTSFIVANLGEFSREVLPRHFKHNNFSSFVRQLNMYGFHKCNKTPRGQKQQPEHQVWEFSHSKFQRNRPDLLEEIKRKAMDSTSGSATSPGGSGSNPAADVASSLALLQVSQNELGQGVSGVQEGLGGLERELAQTKEEVRLLRGVVKQLYAFLWGVHGSLPFAYPTELLPQRHPPAPPSPQQHPADHSLDRPPIFITSPDAALPSAPSTSSTSAHTSPSTSTAFFPPSPNSFGSHPTSPNPFASSYSNASSPVCPLHLPPHQQGQHSRQGSLTLDTANLASMLAAGAGHAQSPISPFGAYEFPPPQSQAHPQQPYHHGLGLGIAGGPPAHSPISPGTGRQSSSPSPSPSHSPSASLSLPHSTASPPGVKRAREDDPDATAAASLPLSLPPNPNAARPRSASHGGGAGSGGGHARGRTSGRGASVSHSGARTFGGDGQGRAVQDEQGDVGMDES